MHMKYKIKPLSEEEESRSACAFYAGFFQKGSARFVRVLPFWNRGFEPEEASARRRGIPPCPPELKQEIDTMCRSPVSFFYARKSLIEQNLL